MIKKSLLRTVAASVLRDRGYRIRPRTGQGLLPGSRLVAKKAGEEIEVAVKASVKRSLSFARLSKNRWRTASAVDLVVAAVPDPNSRADVEVMAFNKIQLIAKFDQAWKALNNAGRPVSFGVPVFVPLDEVAPKNVGHSVGNLKAIAIWSVRLNAEEVRVRTSAETEELFFDRVKREFAKLNGVDVSKVEVEFRVKW